MPQGPNVFKHFYAPRLVLPYSKARHAYHLFHERHPHPIWPAAPAPNAPAPAPAPAMSAPVPPSQGDKTDKTIDHIVPQSIYAGAPKPNVMRSDMHNFFVFPSKLNTRKSNLQYIDVHHVHSMLDPRFHVLDPHGILSCVRALHDAWAESDDEDQHILVTSKNGKTVIPPACLRGLIARTVCYMSTIYDAYAPSIYRNVLDPYTLLDWHRLHPVSKYEYDRAMFVEHVQGNTNPFVKYPELLPLEIERWSESNPDS